MMHVSVWFAFFGGLFPFPRVSGIKRRSDIKDIAE
jgi:hypothetical protein